MNYKTKTVHDLLWKLNPSLGAHICARPSGLCPCECSHLQVFPRHSGSCPHHGCAFPHTRRFRSLSLGHRANHRVMQRTTFVGKFVRAFFQTIQGQLSTQHPGRQMTLISHSRTVTVSSCVRSKPFGPEGNLGSRHHPMSHVWPTYSMGGRSPRDTEERGKNEASWDGQETEVTMHRLLALSCIYFQCNSMYFDTQGLVLFIKEQLASQSSFGKQGHECVTCACVECVVRLRVTSCECALLPLPRHHTHLTSKDRLMGYTWSV